MASKFNNDEDDTKRMLRIADIVEEPRKMLLPIKGYEKVPLVSLEEAVQPLVPFVPDVRRMAWTAKKRCEEPADGLTHDESASIMLYSMEWEPHQECLYFALNTILRTPNRKNLSVWFLYLRLTLTALSHLPSVPLTVYRGVKLDLIKDYPKNKEFVWWGFSSCTRSVEVLEADQFLGKKGNRTLFAINCYSGKNIRNHSYFEKEDEILLFPARQFKVASCLNSGNGLHIIQIDEIEPEYPLLEPLPSIPFYLAPSSQTVSASKYSLLPTDSATPTVISKHSSCKTAGQQHGKTSNAASTKSYDPPSSGINPNGESEWICRYCTLENLASAKRCEICNNIKPAASSTPSVASASCNKKSKSTDHHESYDHHDDSADSDKDNDKHQSRFSQQWNREDSGIWRCDECNYENRSSDIRCKECNEKKSSGDHKTYSAPSSKKASTPNHHSSPAPKSDLKPYSGGHQDDQSSSKSSSDEETQYKGASYSHLKSKASKDSDEETHHKGASHAHSKSKPSKEKTHSPSPPPNKHEKKRIPVYIADLPLDIDDDKYLSSLIFTRIKKVLKIEPIDVQCYSKIGFGILYVSDKQTKYDLINNISTLALNPKEGKTTISFIDTPEMISYIVLDVPKDKIDPILPTAEEISRRWTGLHEEEKSIDCEQLNVQFPNIYRVVSASLNQLIMSLKHQDFKIKNYFARVYFCADCSYLEDLPRAMTQDQLETTVIAAIQVPDITSSSLHIQINKQTGTACIIAANTAKKWAGINHIYVGDKLLTKKSNLSYRLVLQPVPDGLSITSILSNPQFAGKAKVYKQYGQKVILEISDRKTFDECVRRGAIRIANKYTLNMDMHNSL